MAKKRKAAPAKKSSSAAAKPGAPSAHREVYVARASAKAATAAKAQAPFTITVVFLGGLNTAQKNAFKTAADRWASVIVGDLPSVRVDGEVIGCAE